MTWLEQKNFDFNWKSRELRLLTDSLDKWIEITSKDQFDKISILLKENNLTDLSKNTFDFISPNWESFVIKKSNNWINIYWKNNNFITRNLRKYSNNFRLVWIITSWKQFQSLVWDEVYEQDENNLWERLISHVDQIRKESQDRLQKLKEEVIEDEIYKIQKGDTLWKIVKDKYWLTDNRDIANTVNSLVRYNSNIKKMKTDVAPPDGIKWDLIIVWKNIILPWELKVLWKNIKKSKT